MKLTFLTIGLALVAGAADAAPAERKLEERVVMAHEGPGGMDADKDGVVTRAEFQAMHDRMFARLDKNGDGRIGEDEFSRRGHGGEHVEFSIGGPHHPGRPGRHHGPGHHGPGGREIHIVRHGPSGLDENKDGRVSPDEFTSPMREHFQEMDKNRSGYLEKDELDGDGRMFRRHGRRE